MSGSPASATVPAPANTALTVILVNFNSHDFIRLSLKALFFLTKNPVRILICDNGSDYGDFFRLRYLCSFYPNVTLVARTQTSAGSMGHGEALNILMGMVDTPYTAVLDADCIPLALHWDQILIERLSDKVKIAGTPVAHNSPNNKKPIDFPLMFLCLAETRVIADLQIDFRPKDIAAQQDTGWELREKILGAGYQGFCLHGENTRTFRQGPLADCICDEYYLDGARERLFCSHLGRGSNPKSGKYSKSRRQSVKAHRADKEKWLGLCEGIIDGQIRALARNASGPIEYIPCDLCGKDDAVEMLEGMDLMNNLPGSWKVLQCRSCGMVYTNPRPRPETLMGYYPDTYSSYLGGSAPVDSSASPLRALKRKLGAKRRSHLLRQHYGYAHEGYGPSLFWKYATLPWKRRADVDLLPRFPGSGSVPRVLEIGCSIGLRLDYLKSLGWDVVGVEPGAVAAKKARALGIPVHIETIENLDFRPGEFDCIIMGMVLEHLPSPARSLERIGGWLKPGGELLLSVPDWSGIESRLFGKYSYGLQVPTHLFHFTPRTLRRYLSGFDVEISHQAFHRDLRGGLDNYLKAHPESRLKPLLRLPTVFASCLAAMFAMMGRTSRMSVRAKKK